MEEFGHSNLALLKSYSAHLITNVTLEKLFNFSLAKFPYI